MKRIVKVAWSVSASFFLTLFLFLFLVAPARAPHGGKKSLGGRTIASMQEQEFDARILHYQMCYGLRFQGDSSTVERRRVCKAMLVHRLDAVLTKPGAYFRSPLEFRCEDTAFLRSTAATESFLVVMKPNKEFEALESAIQTHLELADVSEGSDQFAKESCTFLTGCKLAMERNRISLRKLAQCFTTGNVVHRKILLDEVAAMLFRAKKNQTKILYPELLGKAPQ